MENDKLDKVAGWKRLAILSRFFCERGDSFGFDQRKNQNHLCQVFGRAFGSALISSIYGIVDMAMVGQYQGPNGTAALAVVAPIWNIIYSLGLLTGIGGSVLFSTVRGKGAQKRKTKTSILPSHFLRRYFLLL